MFPANGRECVPFSFVPLPAPTLTCSSSLAAACSPAAEPSRPGVRRAAVGAVAGARVGEAARRRPARPHRQGLRRATCRTAGTCAFRRSIVRRRRRAPSIARVLRLSTHRREARARATPTATRGRMVDACRTAARECIHAATTTVAAMPNARSTEEASERAHVGRKAARARTCASAVRARPTWIAPETTVRLLKAPAVSSVEPSATSAIRQPTSASTIQTASSPSSKARAASTRRSVTSAARIPSARAEGLIAFSLQRREALSFTMAPCVRHRLGSSRSSSS